MGDRAVIGLKADSEATPVFLYSHWGGSERYRSAQSAIEAARSRWVDPAYATRIAISQIVGDDWGKETGFGISAGHNSFGEPDYDEVLIITWTSQTVDIVSSNDSTKVIATIGFDVFLSLDPDDEALY